MRALSALFVFMLVTSASGAQAQLYRATMIRAAPGQLVELIDAIKERTPVYEAAGEARPFLLRHSQGDQWDLMLLEPLGASLSAYYATAREQRRSSAAQMSGTTADSWEIRLRELSAWREDQIVQGPPLEQLQRAFEGNNFVHLEMFIALAGHHEALVKEREMENAFAKAIGRPENLIFTRVSGAAWDCFTIGNYRDMVHYATSAVVPSATEESAAHAAGFESRASIGPFLRSLINSHHDNLLSVVR